MLKVILPLLPLRLVLVVLCMHGVCWCFETWLLIGLGFPESLGACCVPVMGAGEVGVKLFPSRVVRPGLQVEERLR